LEIGNEALGPSAGGAGGGEGTSGATGDGGGGTELVRFCKTVNRWVRSAEDEANAREQRFH